MKNLRFIGKNKDFKTYLDKAIEELEQKENGSSTSTNAQAPQNN